MNLRMRRNPVQIIEWKSDYSVLVSRFDEQHKELIKLINNVHSAMKEGEGQIMLGGVFHSLADYTKKHFAEEEKLMEAKGYSDISRHKAAHDHLLKKVDELQKEFVEGNGVLSISVLNFLKDWLITHIQGEDKKYGSFFNVKGIY
jgi:hemerythrin